MSTVKKASEQRSRDWILTVPADGDKGVSRDELESVLASYSSYVGQLELSESGYLHWQIYISHVNPIRFSSLKKKLSTAHCEVRRGSVKQAVAYVTKEGTRVSSEKPLVKGEISLKDQQGKRNDLNDLREEILSGSDSLESVLASNPIAWRYYRQVEALIGARDAMRWGTKNRDVQVKVLYGKTGTGKSTTALSSKPGSEIYRVTNYGKGTFDGYSAQPILVLDEFHGQISAPLLLTICDPFPCKLPARYCDKQAAFSELLLVSNLPPWEWYKSESNEVKRAICRRFSEVREFTGVGQSHAISSKTVLERMLSTKLAC